MRTREFPREAADTVQTLIIKDEYTQYEPSKTNRTDRTQRTLVLQFVSLHIRFCFPHYLPMKTIAQHTEKKLIQQKKGVPKEHSHFCNRCDRRKRFTRRSTTLHLPSTRTADQPVLHENIHFQTHYHEYESTLVTTLLGTTFPDNM